MAPVQEHHKVKGLYLKRLNDGYPYAIVGQVVILLITFLYSKDIIDYFKILQFVCYFFGAAAFTFNFSFLVIYYNKYFTEKNVLIKKLIEKVFLKSLLNSIFLGGIGWGIQSFYF